MIRFLGPEPDSSAGWKRLSAVTANADRGSQELQLSDVSQIAVGKWISLTLDPEASGSALHHVLGERPPSFRCTNCDEAGGTGGVVRFHSRVSAVWAGNSTLLLERPLPFAVQLNALPAVYMFMSGISEVGVEYMTIEMRC